MNSGIPNIAMDGGSVGVLLPSLMVELELTFGTQYHYT